MSTIHHGRTTKPAGFTIVELIIVIVVIGIIAAIVIVAYNGIQNRAQFTKAQADSRMVVTKLELYKVDNNAYPTSIIDCPTPAASNLCLPTSSGNTYSYKAVAAGGSVAQPSYELTVMNDKQFLYTSPIESNSASEFMQYTDLAPIIDKYGLVKYQLNFDIKSANIAARSTMDVYFQNGAGARYSFSVTINVTTEFTRQTITFIPTLYDMTTPKAMLAFYGTYGSGNIPTVRNVNFQLAP